MNADAYVSTGQGILGYNMFAYCGNNPVNRIDPTGTFWKGVWNWVVDIYERTMAIQQQQQELDTQIRLQQNEIIADGVKTIYDAYQRGYALEQESIMFQAKANIDMFDSPKDVERSLDIINATYGFSLATYGIVSVAIATGITAGAVLSGVAGVIWSARAIYRAVEQLPYIEE